MRYMVLGLVKNCQSEKRQMTKRPPHFAVVPEHQ